jgi:hypothetical protein
MSDPQQFVATDDGFTDVLTRRSRRRRRRRAALAATTASVTVVVLVAVLSAMDVGTDSLRVVPTGPTGSAAASPTPSTPAQSGQVPTSPPAQPTGAPAVGTTTAMTASAASTATTPNSATSPAPDSISTPMQRSTIAYDNTQPCADTSGREATGWCVQVKGPFSAQRGHPTTLRVTLCRLPGADAQAHFPGTLEADFALQTTGQDSHVRWRYDTQHPDATDDHSYPVRAGTCLLWQTTWAVRADDGSVIGPGSYELVVTVDADNVAAPGEAFARQVYTFTVT